MPLQTLKRVVLPSDAGGFTALTFAGEGRRLLLGTVRGDEALGLTWLEWAAEPVVTQAIILPDDTLPRDIDNSVVGFDLDGETAIAVAGSCSVYAPIHEQIWRVSRRGELPPQLIHQAYSARAAFSISEDATHLVNLNAEDDTPELEVFRLNPFESVVRVPLIDCRGRIGAIAAASNHRRFAVALEDRVIGLDANGKHDSAWPVQGPLQSLSFSEDGLTVWGMSKDALIRFPLNAPALQHRVPNAAPLDLSELIERKVLFLGRDKTVQRLDLVTGTVRQVAALDPHTHFAFDAPSRRIATLSDDGDATVVCVSNLLW